MDLYMYVDNRPNIYVYMYVLNTKKPQDLIPTLHYPTDTVPPRQPAIDKLKYGSTSPSSHPPQ